jgi:hypothetical protein
LYLSRILYWFRSLYLIHSSSFCLSSALSWLCLLFIFIFVYFCLLAVSFLCLLFFILVYLSSFLPLFLNFYTITFSVYFFRLAFIGVSFLSIYLRLSCILYFFSSLCLMNALFICLPSFHGISFYFFPSFRVSVVCPFFLGVSYSLDFPSMSVFLSFLVSIFFLYFILSFFLSSSFSSALRSLKRFKHH